jgi:hypothetical protein
MLGPDETGWAGCGDGVGEQPPLDGATLVFGGHAAVLPQQVPQPGVDAAFDPVRGRGDAVRSVW